MFRVVAIRGAEIKKAMAHGFQYVAWLEIAETFQVRIVNWPEGIKCGSPGPNFYHRGLNVASLEKIFEAETTVESWTDGKSPFRSNNVVIIY